MVQETSESLILPTTAGMRRGNDGCVCVCVCERGSEQVFAHSQGAGLLIMVGVRWGAEGNFTND